MTVVRPLGLALVLLLTACGGGSDSPTDPTPQPPPPPVDPGPASVTILEAHAGPDFGTVAVHLHNGGGPGTYRLEFYGLPTSPNGPDTFFGSTEPVDVDTGYDESVTYTVRNDPSDPPVEYILAFTRQQGSAVYSQTDRHDMASP